MKYILMKRKYFSGAVFSPSDSAFQANSLTKVRSNSGSKEILVVSLGLNERAQHVYLYWIKYT